MKKEISLVGAVILGIISSNVSSHADERIIRPGDESLKLLELVPCTATYENVNRNGQAIGTITTQLTSGTVRDLNAYWWIVTIEGGGRTMIDSIAFDPETIAPLYRSFPHSKRGYHYLSIDGASVRGHIQPPNGAATAVEIDFAEPVFEPSLLDIVIAGLPLEDGYSAELPCANYRKKEVVWATARVRGNETVTADGGRKFDAWVVYVSFSSGQKRTVWIVDESPFRVKSANGWNWRLVKVDK